MSCLHENEYKKLLHYSSYNIMQALNELLYWERNIRTR